MTDKRFEEICSRTIVNIKPTDEEIKKLHEIINLVSNALMTCSRDQSYSVVDIKAGGSVAKGTNLRGDSDIDLFIQIKTQSKKDLEEFIYGILPCFEQKLKTKVVIMFAENPFFSTILDENNKITVDIVPIAYAKTVKDLPMALKVSGMARSPFHTEYAVKKLTDRLKDEVRLLKYFMKQKRSYGVFGFTGWLCELLIIHYKSFYNVLQNAHEISKLKLDIENRLSEKEMAKRFPDAMVIIVDPIDSNRNAAAGIQGLIGKFKLKRFIDNAHKALSFPETMFNPIKPTGNIKIEFSPRKNLIAPRENFLISLGHIALKLNNMLKQYGYQIDDAFIDESPYSLYLSVKPETIDVSIAKGPKIWMKNAVEKFKQVHEQDEIFIKKDRYFAKKKPKYSTNKDAVIAMLDKMQLKMFSKYKIVLIS